MYKVMWLMKRRPGLTLQQFRTHYESVHRLLGEQMLNGYASGYERNYLYPMPGDDAEPLFDVATQLCFPARNGFDRCMSALGNNRRLTELIAEDGQKMLKPGVSRHFEDQESLSTFQTLTPGAPTFRTMRFVQFRRDLPYEECRTYCEHKNRYLREYLMSGYAYSYERHFLYKIAPDAPEPHFSFIAVTVFPSRAIFEGMSAHIAGDPTIAKLIAADETRFIVYGNSGFCVAEQESSALGPLLNEKV
jgi:EthD domain